jgi:hypothetical protein
LSSHLLISSEITLKASSLSRLFVSTPFLRQRLLDFSKFTTTLSDQVMGQMPPQRLAHYLI